MKKVRVKKRKTIKIFIFLVISFVLISFCELYCQRNRSWQFYVSNSIGPNNKFNIFDNLVFDEDHVFFNSQDDRSYSLNQKTGQINWIFRAEDYSPFPTTVDGEQIFLANFDGNIYCLDKETGYKIWQFTTEGQYQPDTPILKSANNDLVFFGSRNGILYALDSNSGQLIWKKQFQKLDSSQAFVSGSIHFGSIYLEDEEIYVFNSLENKFFSIKQLDGSVNWQIDNLVFDYRSPIFLAEKIIIKQKQYLLSIDRKTGLYQQINRDGGSNVAWEIFEIGNDKENLLILDDHTLIKIDNGFSEVQWTLNNVDNILYQQKNAQSPTVEIIDEQILAQTFSRIENLNVLLFVNYDNGELTRTQKIDNWITEQKYNENRLFISSGTGFVYSIIFGENHIDWQTKIDGEVQSINTIKDNLLVISLKSSGKLSLEYLDQETGEEIWTYSTNFLTNKKDFYLQDQSVYVLNQDNTVLNKIEITKQRPKDKNIKKINFSYNQLKTVKDPYLEVEKQDVKSWEIKQKLSRINYLIKNFKEIFSFNISEEVNNNILEISVNNDENLYQNKFTDLKIEATFQNKEQEEKIAIKGFYFDNNTWKIRFCAPQTGEYEYSIKIKSPFISNKYSGAVQLDIGKDEIISIDQGSFVINDQTIFFPSGIQDIFTDRNYNGNLMDMMANSSTTEPVSELKDFSYLDIDDYLDLYKEEAKINIFRYGVDHWTMPLWLSIDPQNIILSINGGKFGDTLIKKLQERDIKIIMTIFGFYPPYRTYEEISNKNNQQTLAFYLDYVIARYSPYVDLWELSNEAEAHELWYKFIIDYLKENDPYHHPISTNWETKSAENSDFQSVHWYNPDETDPGQLANQIAYLKQKQLQQEKVVLISEFGFKNVSYFPNSSESMRILSWLNTFQKMGMIFWTQGQNGIYKNPDNANIYLGPTERSYLAILSDFLPKDMSLPIETKLSLLKDLQTQIYYLKNNDYILAYLLKIDKTEEKNAKLGLNLENDAELEWINPKTGIVFEKITLKQGGQEIIIPSFELDLAMKIKYLGD